MTRHTQTSTSFDPELAQACSTAQVLDELQLHGHHLHDDEPDSRPLPEVAALEATVAALFETLAEPLIDTRLEPDVPDLLWSLTDLFHRKCARVQRQLDDNEDRQRRAQAEQDGSEIRSVELERLIAQGHTLIERRSAFEMLRDRAAEHYEAHTGSAWRPRAGSMVNHRHLTAAMIDSRDFLAAKRKAETEVHLPTGPKVAFGGGMNCNDHHAIWEALDKVHAKHPDMVLIQWRHPHGRRAHRRLLGRQAQRHPDRLQAGLDARRQGRALQAQRPHAGRAADRTRGLPGLRHTRQSRRQGDHARHPSDRLPQARCVSRRGRPQVDAPAAIRTRRWRSLGPPGTLSVSR